MARDGRALDHKVLEGYRLAAIRLHARHVPIATIAKSFGVTKTAVYIWLKKARTRGLSSLRAVPIAGRPPRLTDDQQLRLLLCLLLPARTLGYATDLWSGPRLRHLLKHRFGVVYHFKHMSRLLRNLGLTLKFPERRSLDQDPEEVERWKRIRLPRILKAAAKRHAVIYYMDESLFSLIPYIGKTWAWPSEAPEVYISGRRGKHVGVTAAVNTNGRLFFELTKDDETFTSKVFLRFITKLRQEHPRRPLVLIADGASPHIANCVKEFEEENKSWFRLEILPAYSPELNPTEKVWGFTKTKALNAIVTPDKKELRRVVKQKLRQLKANQSRVASFFHARECN